VSNTNKKTIQVSSLRMEFNSVLMCTVIYQLFQGDEKNEQNGKCVRWGRETGTSVYVYVYHNARFKKHKTSIATVLL